MDMTVAILSLLAGIGVFLIACGMLSSNLESICGNRLRNLFARASDKKLVGVGVGAVSTAAIQSSGATTVLVIGFVNAGVMSLTLAAAIIYGANIGTTITAQIVAWGMSSGSISFTVIFAALTGIGAFISSYAKKDKTRKIGAIVAAFGLLFVGLDLMSNSMEGFAQMESVSDFLASIDNLILLLLLGAALTALVQSSSVMTSVIITMLVAGLIDLEQGIYLTMGSNIGSCIVAIMAGMTSGINAKRTALIHLLFNVFGVIIFTVFGYGLGFATAGAVTYGTIFEGLFGEIQIQLAMFHTFFNVVTVIIMLPLTQYLINLVMKIIPDKNGQALPGVPHLYYVNNQIMKTPAIALGEVKKEILNMAEISMENFTRSIRAITSLDMSEKEMFEAREKELDFITHRLPHYLIKLSNSQLNDRDNRFISTAYRTIIDLERVGDYAENIMEYAEELIKTDKGFSVGAKEEILEMQETVHRLYELAYKAYSDKDNVVLEEAYAMEQKVDDLTLEVSQNHVRRLGEGVCIPAVGAYFLSLASDIERVADHYINFGNAIRDLK